MRDDLATQAFPILVHGLNLRDKVKRGGKPALYPEQAVLKGFLGAGSQPVPWGNGVDAALSAGINETKREFLGLRYLLACWLDEILIDAGWREWDESKLEAALYRTNIRYGNFWAQVRAAEASPGGPDAQELALLCVLLGFRGELGDDPAKLREWVSGARSRVTGALSGEPRMPADRGFATDVPPLTGIEAYRTMTRRLVTVVLAAVPAIAFLLIFLFR
jgi:type VI protein secretion system component VasF